MFGRPHSDSLRQEKPKKGPGRSKKTSKLILTSLTQRKSPIQLLGLVLTTWGFPKIQGPSMDLNSRALQYKYTHKQDHQFTETITSLSLGAMQQNACPQVLLWEGARQSRPSGCRHFGLGAAPEPDSEGRIPSTTKTILWPYMDVQGLAKLRAVSTESRGAVCESAWCEADQTTAQ